MTAFAKMTGVQNLSSRGYDGTMATDTYRTKPTDDARIKVCGPYVVCDDVCVKASSVQSMVPRDGCVDICFLHPAGTRRFKDVTFDEVISAFIQAIGWEHAHWGLQGATTKPLPTRVSSVTG